MYKKLEISKGFTLIELSIVLVLIGLIIAGILVGRSLITAAATRAQISQINKFASATMTFRGKYGHLPGDIPLTDANQFGLPATNVNYDTNHGNGIIDGPNPEGEASLFWQQLGAAHLIEGNYQNVQLYNNGNASVYGSNVGLYLPRAKIGIASTHIYVWANGPTGGGAPAANGMNYFGIGGVPSLLYGWNWMTSVVALTPTEAYSIDAKADDGLPQSGVVTAAGATGSFDGGRWFGAYASSPYQGAPTTAATAASSTTCYDNGNTVGATQRYSVTTDNGMNVTCGISFRF